MGVRADCGRSGPLFYAGDWREQKCFQKSVPVFALDSKLFAHMEPSAPGWTLRMAVASVSQAESLGPLMVLQLFFGCHDDAGLTKLNNVFPLFYSGYVLLSFSSLLWLIFSLFFLCLLLALYIESIMAGFDTSLVKLYVLTHLGFMISL